MRARHSFTYWLMVSGPLARLIPGFIGRRWVMKHLAEWYLTPSPLFLRLTKGKE